MGSCGFGGGGPGDQRSGSGTEAGISATSRTALDHHRNRPGTGARSALARTMFSTFLWISALPSQPYLRRLRPELVVIAETEFWPNFLRLAHAGGARIAVVNARISDRSLPNYRRWRRILTRVLRLVDIFLAQTEEDRRRLLAIGAPADRVQVSGNLKFDVPMPAPPPIVAKPPRCSSNSASQPCHCLWQHGGRRRRDAAGRLPEACSKSIPRPY